MSAQPVSTQRTHIGQHSPRTRHPRLSDEQRDFVKSEIERGLNNPEVVRMFFRRFDTTIALTTVENYRKNRI